MPKNLLDVERSIGRLEGKLDTVVTIVTDLKAQFDVLEKGRLSGLEVSFATLNAEVGTRAKNTALWTGAIVSICVSIASGIIIYILNLKGA